MKVQTETMFNEFFVNFFRPVRSVEMKETACRIGETRRVDVERAGGRKESASVVTPLASVSRPGQATTATTATTNELVISRIETPEYDSNT